jgi:hypothetical protein
LLIGSGLAAVRLRYLSHRKPVVWVGAGRPRHQAARWQASTKLKGKGMERNERKFWLDQLVEVGGKIAECKNVLAKTKRALIEWSAPFVWLMVEFF